MPPELVEGETVAKVTVPAESANSEVGFSSTVIQVDEGNTLSTLVFINTCEETIMSNQYNSICYLRTKAANHSISRPTYSSLIKSRGHTTDSELFLPVSLIMVQIYMPEPVKTPMWILN